MVGVRVLARDVGAETPGGGAQHALGLLRPNQCDGPQAGLALATPSCWGRLPGGGAPSSLSLTGSHLPRGAACTQGPSPAPGRRAPRTVAGLREVLTRGGSDL